MSQSHRAKLMAMTKDQLVNAILNKTTKQTCKPTSLLNKVKKPPRPFDMDKYKQAHVAIRLAYLGHEYHGMQFADGDIPTIESVLFQALYKLRLIEDRKDCDFSRGGRTDTGVSALGQVVALRLRAGPKNQQHEGELDYVRLLNKVLPHDVRALSWAPVPATFSARFDASHREYKYFFLRRDLDIDLMKNAAQRLVGEHDFRNFCKIDPDLNSFSRRIDSIAVRPLEEFDQVWEFHIVGSAFLWHQVRCMVAVLFMVGRKQEVPDIVDRLLDIQTLPARPVYDMAPEGPLVLYDISYKKPLPWRHSSAGSLELMDLWQQQFEAGLIRSALIRTGLQSIRGLMAESGIFAKSSAFALPTHVPLLDRKFVDSVEECVRKEELRKQRKRSREGEKGAI